MKNDISFLPEEKREELNTIISYILAEVPETEIIILYGSYATGKYVEYDQRTEYNVNTFFMSDYDLVVLTPKKKASRNSIMRRLNNAAKKFYAGHHFSTVTPIQFIHYSVEEFNKAISEGRYFYTDIRKEGILLYNKGNYQIADIRELNFKEIKKLAQEYFEEKYTSGNEFLEGAQFYYDKENYKKASFMLHQATENYLFAIILASSLYSPKEHNLSKIITDTTLFTDKAIHVFPNDTKEEERLFRLLEDAYVQARYNKDFKVKKSDIDKLYIKIEELKAVTKQVCEEKIQEYTEKIK